MEIAFAEDLKFLKRKGYLPPIPLAFFRFVASAAAAIAKIVEGRPFRHGAEIEGRDDLVALGVKEQIAEFGVVMGDAAEDIAPFKRLG